jgi:predicted kinase
MQRLADEDRADERLASGRLGSDDLERLAACLSRFHARARTGSEIDAFGSVASIGFNVHENFEQARAGLRSVATERELQQVEKQQLEFLNANGALFQDRIDRHRIRDGHGDLRLEHVYFHADEPPVILDCIEFNERFRFADVCADVGFLTMDMAWHGRTDLAEAFLAAYARESEDYDLYSVVNFYESYRAYVRAKICAIGYAASGLGSDSRRRLEQDARRYLLLALAAERPSIEPARLIAVGGLIASGKSTVAEALGRALAAPVISSDRTRKGLLGVPAARAILDAPWQDAYSEEKTDQVYAEVLRRAKVVLDSGRTVIVDASFRARGMRERAQQLARAGGAAFTFVECRVPLEVSRRRLEQRARGPSISDGRLEILEEFVQRYEPIVELAGEHLVVDSTGTVTDSLDQLARAGLLTR